MVVDTEAQLLPTTVAGFESHLTRRTHALVQLYASPSVYDGEQTDMEELLSTCSSAGPIAHLGST